MRWLVAALLVVVAVAAAGAQAQQPFAPTCEAKPACQVQRETIMLGTLEIWISAQGRAWQKQQPAAAKVLRAYAKRDPKGAGVTPDLLSAGKTAFSRGIEALLLAYKLTRGEGFILP